MAGRPRHSSEISSNLVLVGRICRILDAEREPVDQIVDQLELVDQAQTATRSAALAGTREVVACLDPGVREHELRVPIEQALEIIDIGGRRIELTNAIDDSRELGVTFFRAWKSAQLSKACCPVRDPRRPVLRGCT